MNNENELYNKIATVIIKQQKELIGDYAYTQLRDVQGIELKDGNVEIISNDKIQVLDNIIKVYYRLFGKVSVEVSKDAIKKLGAFPKGYLPQILE